MFPFHFYCTSDDRSKSKSDHGDVATHLLLPRLICCRRRPPRTWSQESKATALRTDFGDPRQLPVPPLVPPKAGGRPARAPRAVRPHHNGPPWLATHHLHRRPHHRAQGARRARGLLLRPSCPHAGLPIIQRNSAHHLFQCLRSDLAPPPPQPHLGDPPPRPRQAVRRRPSLGPRRPHPATPVPGRLPRRRGRSHRELPVRHVLFAVPHVLWREARREGRQGHQGRAAEPPPIRQQAPRAKLRTMYLKAPVSQSIEDGHGDGGETDATLPSLDRSPKAVQAAAPAKDDVEQRKRKIRGFLRGFPARHRAPGGRWKEAL